MTGKVISIEAMVSKEDAPALKAELEAVLARHSSLHLNTLVRNFLPGHTWYMESAVNEDSHGWMSEHEIWEVFEQKLAQR